LSAASQSGLAGQQNTANHIPFRRSKLTHLLSNSLGGPTLTKLIVTLSPSPEDCWESIETLKYAEEAKSITELKKQVHQIIKNQVRAPMHVAKTDTDTAEAELESTKNTETEQLIKEVSERKKAMEKKEAEALKDRDEQLRLKAERDLRQLNERWEEQQREKKKLEEHQLELQRQQQILIQQQHLFAMTAAADKRSEPRQAPTKVHTRPRPRVFPCPTCGKEFDEERKLGQHVEGAHRKQCPVCHKVFDEDRKLEQHKDDTGHDRNYHTYTCSICGKDFDEAFKLQQHLDDTNHRRTRRR